MMMLGSGVTTLVPAVLVSGPPHYRMHPGAGGRINADVPPDGSRSPVRLCTDTSSHRPPWRTRSTHQDPS